MNSIAWPENPTIEDVPDRLVEMCRASDGNTGMLAFEIYHALHGYGTAHEINEDGARRIVENMEPEHEAIIGQAYHGDARRIVEIVEEHDGVE